MKAGLLLLLMILTCIARAQQLKPAKITGEHFGKDLYYIRINPESPIKGLCVIIPGLEDAPYSPVVQSAIPAELVKNGFAIIIPILSKDNMLFTIQSKDLNTLGLMIADYAATAKLTNEIPIIIGGISLGGTTALKFYAENQAGRLKCHFNNITNVFAVDPPLDMVRLRNTLIKLKDKETLAIMDSSFSYFLNRKAKLKQLSVYNPSKKSPLPSFINTKMRIYCEPDINWYLTQRNIDLYEMNVLDCSAYINALSKEKNNQVELILTENKGYRQSSQGKERNPHSWSIADAQDFVKWILSPIRKN